MGHASVRLFQPLPQENTQKCFPESSVPNTVPGTWRAQKGAGWDGTRTFRSEVSIYPWQASRGQASLSHPGYMGEAAGPGHRPATTLLCSEHPTIPKSVPMMVNALCPAKTTRVGRVPAQCLQRAASGPGNGFC